MHGIAHIRHEINKKLICTSWFPEEKDRTFSGKAALWWRVKACDTPLKLWGTVGVHLYHDGAYLAWCLGEDLDGAQKLSVPCWSTMNTQHFDESYDFQSRLTRVTRDTYLRRTASLNEVCTLYQDKTNDHDNPSPSPPPCCIVRYPSRPTIMNQPCCKEQYASR